jgi:dihydroorotate dehydrogenase electron transfer subunit
MQKHQIKASILSNEEVAKGTFCMTLTAPLIADDAKPGQFVNVRVEQNACQLLRMPFCVYDLDKEFKTISICYQVVGEGTSQLSKLSIGDVLDVVGPLGNGWEIPKNTKRALLICGGLGAAPMNLLAKELKDCGICFDICIGAANIERMICKDEFESMTQSIGGILQVCTDDGSFGFHGFCTQPAAELLDENKYDYCAICGPYMMEKVAVQSPLQHLVHTQVSLEKLMACGIGACLSCIVETKNGKKRCCADGPVFNAGDLIW